MVGDHLGQCFAEPVDLASENCGVPLLVLDSFRYESAEVSLQAGDHVVLYTDGLNESTNAKNEMYGISRLSRQITGYRDGQEIIQHLIDDIHTFSEGVAQNDDMCLVCCTRLGHGRHNVAAETPELQNHERIQGILPRPSGSKR